MSRFRRKPDQIEAHQWFKNGDHPNDGPQTEEDPPREGKLVRYFRDPYMNGEKVCSLCGHKMKEHGWMENGFTVCPGDWIVEKPEAVFRPMKPDTFERIYERID